MPQLSLHKFADFESASLCKLDRGICPNGPASCTVDMFPTAEFDRKDNLATSSASGGTSQASLQTCVSGRVLQGVFQGHRAPGFYEVRVQPSSPIFSVLRTVPETRPDWFAGHLTPPHPISSHPTPLPFLGGRRGSGGLIRTCLGHRVKEIHMELESCTRHPL